MAVYNMLIELSKQAVSCGAIFNRQDFAEGMFICDMVGSQGKPFTIEYIPYYFSVYFQGNSIAMTSRDRKWLYESYGVVGEKAQLAESLIRGFKGFLPPQTSIFGEIDSRTGLVLAIYHMSNDFVANGGQLVTRVFKLPHQSINPAVINAAHNPTAFWELVGSGRLKPFARYLLNLTPLYNGFWNGHPIMVINNLVYTTPDVQGAPRIEDCQNLEVMEHWDKLATSAKYTESSASFRPWFG
jgi:hypothetical protein